MLNAIGSSGFNVASWLMDLIPIVAMITALAAVVANTKRAVLASDMLVDSFKVLLLAA